MELATFFTVCLQLPGLGTRSSIIFPGSFAHREFLPINSPQKRRSLSTHTDSHFNSSENK